MNKKFLSFGLRGNTKLFSQLNHVSNGIQIGNFKDGETYLKLDEDVRQKEIVLY